MKTGVCFSGQGAQRPGMFKKLYENSEDVREVFAVANEVLGFNVSEVCFNGPASVLNQTIYTQPCVLMCDIAAWEVIKKQDVDVSYLAGFSLGEYAALYAAGVFQLEDVFKIIKVRAKAMQEAVPIGQGAMIAIQTTDANTIERICHDEIKEYVKIANYNSVDQIVVAGYCEGVEELGAVLRSQGVRCSRLPVSAPFHCKLMEPARLELEKLFKNITFKEAQIPVIMNYDGQITTSAEEIKRKLLLQTISAVQWLDIMKAMVNNQVEYFIECGPGNTLTKFTKRSFPQIKTQTGNDVNLLELMSSIKKSRGK